MELLTDGKNLEKIISFCDSATWSILVVKRFYLNFKPLPNGLIPIGPFILVPPGFKFKEKYSVKEIASKIGLNETSDVIV